MERKLTIKEFLRVFDYIRSTGERLNNKYKLGDVYAWHDYDGYTEMLTEARTIATERLVAEAEKLGADAIVGVRFTTSSVTDGASEIMAFGTAVKLRT